MSVHIAAPLATEEKRALAYGFTYIFKQLHVFVLNDLKHKIESAYPRFATVSSQELIMLSGDDYHSTQFRSAQDLFRFLDTVQHKVWLDDTIQSSRRFYSVCHSLYAHIGDAAGLSLLLEIVPMWSLGGIICSFDGVPRSHDRSNAAHPDIVDSAWVRSVPAQNPQHEAAMVSNIFLSLARLPIDVSYRALKDLVKETDSDINCVNYLEILFFHPIMVAFWDEAFARNGLVRYRLGGPPIFQEYLRRLYEQHAVPPAMRGY